MNAPFLLRLSPSLASPPDQEAIVRRFRVADPVPGVQPREFRIDVHADGSVSSGLTVDVDGEAVEGVLSRAEAAGFIVESA